MCHEYAAHTDMDANQSVQDGREGETDDVVEDGEGGGKDNGVSIPPLQCNNQPENWQWQHTTIK